MNEDATPKIDHFINSLLPWQKEICAKLRAIVRDAEPEIVEEWKWGKPAFSHSGLVCIIVPLKNYVSFVFSQGSLIKDKYGLFVNATKTDRSRTIKFTAVQDIDGAKLAEYLKAAVANNARGLKVKPRSRDTGEIVIPPDILNELHKRGLYEKFEDRPPYQRRDYLSWIKHAKRLDTQTKRLEQMLEELLTGDRYMNMPYEPKVRRE